MKLRVITAYSCYSVGDIIEPPAMFGEQLMSRGLAEPVREEPREVAIDAGAETRETAVAAIPPKRKRGRPRKYPVVVEV
jgi:hypothetical protein